MVGGFGDAALVVNEQHIKIAMRISAFFMTQILRERL